MRESAIKMSCELRKLSSSWNKTVQWSLVTNALIIEILYFGNYIWFPQVCSKTKAFRFTGRKAFGEHETKEITFATRFRSRRNALTPSMVEESLRF